MNQQITKVEVNGSIVGHVSLAPVIKMWAAVLDQGYHMPTIGVFKTKTEAIDAIYNATVMDPEA